ncbi:MAG: bifunctional (p)ppGpp synthetase/guanosine-3',5'-bis(diphosphate) 3'-pyrophosphohydrolase [Lachnospiraceae bacterium]|nr:bifunctional (p)ppGpp synthetase/guanosine-3',5'-bis(diphosphate) 3'-pyrophosphohydrolase [Lachnospiraceae bacterium]
MEQWKTPQELFDGLIERVRRYHPSDDVSQIEKAFRLAEEAHADQKRRSGEPYIAHPLMVAQILAELEMDKETIVAGLLHDVVEDTRISLDDVRREFGDEVAALVDGVTKLTQISWEKDKVEVQAENLRKMFLAMARDIRVIIIKLADRLHNMRTAEYWSPEKQIEKARETMDIYSPIAHRLGISKIKVELDDLSLRILEPEVYKDLSEQVERRMADREVFVERITKEVEDHMHTAEISCKVVGRVKHFFSIYKKMVNQHKTLDQIYDLFAVRILVDTVKDCYAALGTIHEMYKPIPGRFKDYIAMPKPNMYQSLHTTVISGTGEPFEIQIRTYDMHRTAEYGIAAHWKYKEGRTGTDSEEEKLAWLRQILEWQRDMSDNQEFMSSIKNDLDLFSENVYCFTPTGDVKSLPAGSTPVDFAYSVHSAVGNRMVGARVNEKLVPIDYRIQNGDRVEIITSQNSKGPSRDWLNVVRSTQARNKINQWFKSQYKEENISRGKDAVAAYAKSKGIVLSDISRPEFQAKVLKKYGFRDWDAILAAIGHGGLTEGQVVNKLQEEYDKKHKREVTDEEIIKATEVGRGKVTVQHGKNGIVVKGIDDLAVRFSHCCNPVPGDEIVGFVTRGRGISIHRTDCVNMLSLPAYERGRLIEAQWQDGAQAISSDGYSTEITIYCTDRTGMLVDIARVMTEKQININSLESRVSKQGVATVTMSFNVPGISEVLAVSEKLRQIDGVKDVKRTRG